jgi:hypothetical protein
MATSMGGEDAIVFCLLDRETGVFWLHLVD